MNLENQLREALNTHYPYVDVAEIQKIHKGLSNFNFLLKNREGGKIFAKIFRASNALEVTREVGLIDYLTRAGILTPKIYKTESGRDYGIIGNTPFILYEYLEGHYPEPTIEDATSVGRLIASIHVLPVPPDIRSRHKTPYSALKSQLADIVVNMGSFERNLLLEAMNLCRVVKNSRARKGLVHTDVFLDNCIKRSDSRIYLLDFEKAGLDCFLLDIGRAVVGCCLRDGIIDFNIAMYLMGGYSSIRKLTKGEWDELYDWVIFSILLSIVWRYIEFNFKRPNEGRQRIYQAFIPSLARIMELEPYRFLALIRSKRWQMT